MGQCIIHVIKIIFILYLLFGGHGTMYIYKMLIERPIFHALFLHAHACTMFFYILFSTLISKYYYSYFHNYCYKYC